MQSMSLSRVRSNQLLRSDPDCVICVNLVSIELINWLMVLKLCMNCFLKMGFGKNVLFSTNEAFISDRVCNCSSTVESCSSLIWADSVSMMFDCCVFVRDYAIVNVSWLISYVCCLISTSCCVIGFWIISNAYVAGNKNVCKFSCECMFVNVCSLVPYILWCVYYWVCIIIYVGVCTFRCFNK